MDPCLVAFGAFADAAGVVVAAGAGALQDAIHNRWSRHSNMSRDSLHPVLLLRAGHCGERTYLSLMNGALVSGRAIG